MGEPGRVPRVLHRFDGAAAGPGDPLLRNYLGPRSADGRVRLSGDALIDDAAEILFAELAWDRVTVPIRFATAEWSVGTGTPPAYPPEAVERIAEKARGGEVSGVDHAALIMTRGGAEVAAGWSGRRSGDLGAAVDAVRRCPSTPAARRAARPADPRRPALHRRRTSSPACPRTTPSGRRSAILCSRCGHAPRTTSQHAVVGVRANCGVPVVTARRRHRALRRGERGRRLPGAGSVADEPGAGDRSGQPASCVVEPGVVNDDLKAAVAEHGLWYPPDPASSPWSTIGGNVATNAGGLCCVKYGVTRDYVLGLRAVVGGPVEYGTVARIGRRTAKGVAGYDLTALMVGSEGTLGVAHRDHPAAAAGPAGTAAHGGRRVRQPGRRRSGRRRGGPRRADAVGAGTARPGVPDGGRGVEAPRHRGRRGGVAAGQGRHPGAGRRARGAGGDRRLRCRRPALGGAVRRPGGGGGAVRRAPARLPGTGTARPGAHRGHLRAAVERYRRCSAGWWTSRRGTVSGWPRSRTPGTAICIRCC